MYNIDSRYLNNFIKVGIIFLLSFFYSNSSYSQSNSNTTSSFNGNEISGANGKDRRVLLGYKVVNGDTLFIDKIAPIYVFNRDDKRKASRAWREYYKTVYNFKKVYPYALKAKEIISEADSLLKYSNFTKREREKYLREYQKRLFREFEHPLRGLSFSQGRLLLRLLDRELGRSSYYIIKNYRGGVAAGFWQGIAKIFGSDLKRPYDKFGVDKPVEELIELYERGAFDYLYYSMFSR